MQEGFSSHNTADETTGAQAPVLPKADFLERFIAKFIDFLIVGAFFAFPSAVGPLAGTTYILISDGLKEGQSIGKRIIGLRAVSTRDAAAPCDFKQSIIRNSLFAVLILWYYLVGWIPYIGKALTVLLWAAAVGIESALIYIDERGARFGDRIAGTQVVHGKVTKKVP